MNDACVRCGGGGERGSKMRDCIEGIEKNNKNEEGRW